MSIVGKELARLSLMSKGLKKIGLLEEFNYVAEDIELSLSEIRRLDYVELWKTYFSKNCYNFHFIDGSLIFFNSENNSYSYLGVPYDCLTFPDFLHEYGFQNESEKHLLRPEYEQYVSECKVKEFPFSIRYDYDENSYNPGIHPVSHMHMGFNTQTRIGLSHILTPSAFVCFIVRQMYPSHWQLALNQTGLVLKKVRDELLEIDTKFYNKNDKLELYLK